jgi:hypothetical protein
MFGDIILRKQHNGQVEEQTELEIWAQLHEQVKIKKNILIL